MVGQYLHREQPPLADSKHWQHDESLDSVFTIPSRSIHGSKGVDRVVILAMEITTDAHIERIIEQKARELAQEGKRIYLPPKWL